MSLIKGIIFLILFYGCLGGDGGGGGSDVEFDRAQLGTLLSDSNDQDLGEVPYQTPYDLIVEIRNDGVLTARSIVPREDDEVNPVFYYAGEDFPGEKGTCGEVLAPGEACDLHFTFYTDIEGVYEKTFYFDYHDGENKSLKSLTLTAKAGRPAEMEFIGSNAGLYDLGGQNVNGGSKNQTITIKNIGDLTATDINMDLQGKTLADNNVYSFLGGSYPGVGGSCAQSLTGGESCTVVIEYLALAQDVSYQATLNIDFRNPLNQDAAAALFKLLGIDDRAFLLATPAEQYIIDPVLNTSTNNLLTWRLKNVGSQPASDFEIQASAIDGMGSFYFANDQIALDFDSTNCGTQIAPNTFCDISYSLKPNFPNDRIYPVTVSDLNYDQKLLYNDGVNADRRENDDVAIFASVLGEGVLSVERDKALDQLVEEGSVWESENWTHVVGESIPRTRSLRLRNGFSSNGRVEISNLSISITPNDGLLTIDPLASDTILSGEFLDIDIEYLSSLDLVTYPYTDASNRIREYDIKIAYNNQVESKELNFKIQGKDQVIPIVKFAKVTYESDDITVASETFMNPTVNNADNSNQTGESAKLYFPEAYMNSDANSEYIRVYNYGAGAISPAIELMAGADNAFYSIEKRGTTCDDPILNGTYCEFKLVFNKTTAVDDLDITVVEAELNNGNAHRFEAQVRIRDEFSFTQDSTLYDFDKELLVDFIVAQRKKGELGLRTEHNPNNRPVGHPSFNLYSDTDFVGDFQTVDSLYEGEAERIVSGDNYILHFTKTYHGEIKDLICNVTGADSDYFTCTVEAIPTDDTVYGEYLTAIGQVIEPYDSTKHVKYVAKMSFKVDGTSTIRDYNAVAEFEYHGRDEASTDPYQAEDKFDVNLTASVKAEPNFIFILAEGEELIDLGDFKIEEALAPVIVEIKNIGGSLANTDDLAGAVLSYNTDLYDLAGFDDADANCTHVSDNDAAGEVVFNASAGGICRVSLTPIFEDNLGAEGSLGNFSGLTLDLSYDTSYTRQNELLLVKANQLPAFQIEVDGVIMEDPVLNLSDFRLGEEIETTIKIHSQLGKDSNLLEGGSGSPLDINISDLTSHGQFAISGADDTADCDYSVNPSLASPVLNLTLHMKAGAVCDLTVLTVGKKREPLIFADYTYSTTNEQGQPVDISVGKNTNFDIVYDSSVYTPLTKNIIASRDQIEVLNPYSILVDGVAAGGNPSLNFPDVRVGEAITKTITVQTNLGKPSADLGLPFKFTIDDIANQEKVYLTNTNDTVGCDFSSVSSIASPISSVTFDAEVGAACSFDLTIFGKGPGLILTEALDQVPKNLDMWVSYDPVDYGEGLTQYFKFNDGMVDTINPLSSTQLLEFSDMYIGDNEELNFSIHNGALIASDAGFSYFTGPITLDFAALQDAGGSGKLTFVPTTGCTLVLATDTAITYHANADTTCNFKLKLEQKVYSQWDLTSSLFLNLRASIAGFQSRVRIQTGAYQNSFDITPELTQNLENGEYEEFLGQGVIGSELTYDFSVTSLTSHNTSDIKKLGSETETIDPVIVKVTDFQNYRVEWQGGTPSAGCTQEEVGVGNSYIKFHINAGVTCNFQLIFTVPAVGEKPNEVVVEHVGFDQERQSIYGSGLNYAIMQFPTGFGSLDIGEYQGSVESGTIDIILNNIESEAANGMLVGLPTISTAVDCTAPRNDEIPASYRNADDNIVLERTSSVFSVESDTCDITTEFLDDKENECGFSVRYTPVTVDRVHYACVSYTYKRYPTEPETDPVTGDTNWQTRYITVFGNSVSPPLVFAGFNDFTVRGGQQVSFSWNNMTMAGATIEGYTLERKRPDDIEYTPLPGYENVLVNSFTEPALEAGLIYEYRLKAHVVYDATPGLPAVAKLPDEGSSPFIKFAYPYNDQVYISNFGGVGAIVDMDESSETFQSHGAAASYCSDMSYENGAMSLLSDTQFTTLASMNVANSVLGGNWEYISNVITVSASFPAFDEESLTGDVDITADLVIDINGMTGICKNDGINNPDDPYLTRYGMAGGDGTGAILPDSETSFFYCYPDYAWIELSGSSYPDAAARCIIEIR